MASATEVMQSLTRAMKTGEHGLKIASGDYLAGLLGMVSEYTTQSFTQSQTTMDVKHSTPIPVMMQVGTFMIKGSLWVHEGHLVADWLISDVEHFKANDMPETHEQKAETKSDTVGVNPLTASVNVGTSESVTTIRSTQHNVSSITIKQGGWIRANTADLNLKLRAKYLDMVVRNHLTLYSLMDEYEETKEHSGVHVGLSLGTAALTGGTVSALDVAKSAAMASGFTEGSERRFKKWQSEGGTADITATDFLRLVVNGKLHTIGAKVQGPVDLGTPDTLPTHQDAVGQAWYEVPLPVDDGTGDTNLCGFFGLETHRQMAVWQLLEAASNDEIRSLVAPEIREAFVGDDLPQDVQDDPSYEPIHRQYNAAQTLLDTQQRDYNTRFEAEIRALGIVGFLSAPVLLEKLDPDRRDARFKDLSDALDAMDKVKADLRTWAESEDIYKAFIEGTIANPGVMLSYLRDDKSGKSRTGLMDAIAKLNGLDIRVYQRGTDGKVEVVHAYQGGTTTIDLLHTAYDPAHPDVLNHFNRLYNDRQSISVGERIDEILHGLDEHEKEENLIAQVLAFGQAAVGLKDGWESLNRTLAEAQRRWSGENERSVDAEEGERESSTAVAYETERKPISTNKVKEEAFYSRALADLGNSILDFVGKTNQHLKLGLAKEKVVEFANKLVEEAKVFYGQFRELGHSVQKSWNQTVNCMAANLKAYVSDLAKTPRVMEVNAAIGVGIAGVMEVGVILYRAIQVFKAYNTVNDALEKRQHGSSGSKSLSSATLQVKDNTGTTSGGSALPPEDPEGGDGRKGNCAKQESSIWKSFQNFRDGLKSNGQKGTKREYYEWDHMHNDIEVYSHQGNHLGSMDPISGKIYRAPVIGRTIKDRIK